MILLRGRGRKKGTRTRWKKGAGTLWKKGAGTQWKRAKLSVIQENYSPESPFIWRNTLWTKSIYVWNAGSSMCLRLWQPRPFAFNFYNHLKTWKTKHIYSNLFYLKCTQTMQCTGKHVRVVILILSLCKSNVSNVFLISVIFLSCLGTNTFFPIVSLV